MAITAGKRLGPYEILSQIGAGGMGEVYKARDTRLDRIVAIKVLPPHLANNGEARERFEREARTIGQLNHPHICTLHDIGEQDGIHYLVMEYLDGENLHQRLQKGPLPLEQVLQYATEIIDALDAAHRHGATHRDIKPGNIMLTKTAGSKVLDFGLAKLRQEVNPIVPLSEMPTRDGPLTEDGRILGTMYYMAPEQVEGKTKEIDGRADIFSFGAVVYEMATGKRAFEGQTKASVMAKILEHNPPPMSTLQPMTPPALDSVVKTCLAKDREDRVQTARDLCRELKWIKEASSQAVAATATPQPATKLWQRVLPWAVAAVAIVVALLAVFLPSRSATPTAPMRFSVSPPENTSLLSDLAERTPLISPDGQRLAFVARGSDDINMLWVRPLDSLTAQPLPGTEGASTPFWSVDSRFLGFIAERKLKKIEVSGGPPQTLAAPGDGGGTWNSQGEIVFRRGNTLSRVSAAGGEATPVTTLNQSRQEGMHVRPDFLPDGRHFLYFASSANPENNGVYAGSLDSQETVRLLNANSMAQYAPPGYLLFVRGDALMAQPFNATRLQLTGEAFPVAAQVYADPTYGSAAFSVSNNGVLVYRTGVGNFRSQLTWFDRTGKQIGTVGPPGVYFNPKLSPDGKRVAVEQVTSGNRDIWILDIERGIATRFTFDATDELDPLWSPDGKYIAFVSTRDSLRSLYQKLSSGAGSEEVLLKGAVGTIAHDWSLDGRFITYRPSAGIYIWVLPLFGDRKPFSYLQPEFGVASSQISPDGKWLAYRSNESGRWEGFVQSFPKPGAKWQVSANGGAQPRWRRDGKELFYIALDGKLMAVPIKGEESLEIGTPQALFETRTAGGASALPTSLAQYDVSSDGQRFLMNVGPEAASTIPITVVLNWLAGVKR